MPEQEPKPVLIPLNKISLIKSTSIKVKPDPTHPFTPILTHIAPCHPFITVKNPTNHPHPNPPALIVHQPTPFQSQPTPQIHLPHEPRQYG